MKIARPHIIFFILIVMVDSSFAQLNQDAQVHVFNSPRNEKVKPAQSRPQDLIIFLGYARAAQPEFAADLLISLAESGKIADPTWKCELLEEAFRLAANAQQPFKRTYTSIIHPIDTRAGYLSYAFDLKLDSLSLRCRVINALLSIDKKKARELFREIPKMELKPISCDESLVYDVADFYATLAAIAQTAFTAKEKGRGEPIHFVETYINDMVSPVQVGPLANAVLAIKPHRDSLERLVYDFGNALQQIAGDDRAFWSSYRSTFDSLSKLLIVCQEIGVSGDDLIRAYRTYLIKQLGGELCADTYKARKKNMAGLIDAFHEKMKSKSIKNILPILADDLKPTKIEGEEKAFWYWQSPKAATLLEKIKGLRFGSGKEPLTDAEKQTREWAFKLNEFLEDMANWRKEDEKSEADYLNQKCFLYRTLLELIPEGSARDEVLRDYVTFLDEFDLQRGSRIEWFWQASYFIKRMLALPEEKRIKLFEKTGAMKNPILYLYMEFGKLKLKSQES